MKMHLWSAALLMLSGCTGSPEPGGDGGSDAQAGSDGAAGADLAATQDLATATGADLVMSAIKPASFAAARTYKAVRSPGMAAGDFNGDGRTDAAASSGGTLRVLLNDGLTGLDSTATYDIPGIGWPLVADTNGDKKEDILVVMGAGIKVGVLLSKGDGTFNDPVSTTTGSPTSLQVGDFDGDGRIDLVVGHSATIDVLLGNGDGTFGVSMTTPFGPGPARLLPADLNGDAKLDLAVLTSSPSGAVHVLLGKGDGTFQAAVAYPMAGHLGLVAADLNADKKLDLATLDQTGLLRLFLGNGDGTFGAVRGFYPSCPNPTNLVGEDLNGDGAAELVAACADRYLRVFVNKGDATYGAPMPYVALVFGGYGMVFGEINGDGKRDLVVADQLGWKVNTILGNGDGTFQGAQPYPAAQAVTAVAADDLDGDGRVDLAVVDRNAVKVSIHRGTGGGKFTAGASYVAVGVEIVTGDFRGVGRRDLAVVDGLNTASVLLGNGDGTFQNGVDSAVGKTPVALAAGDLNGDGRDDLAVVGSGDHTLSVLLASANGALQPATKIPAGNTPLGVTSIDLDGDGKRDLIVTSSSTHEVLVYLGKGDGTLNPPVAYPVPITRPAMVTTADLDGDGHRDVLVANRVADAVGFVVLAGKAGGGLDAAVTHELAAGLVGAIAVADFNGDGRPDVVAPHGLADDYGIAVLLGIGDRSFAPPADYVGENLTASLIVGDLNGDKKPDILAVASNMLPSVSFLFNTTP